MEQSKATREEKILRICEAVKDQSESEQAVDNVLLSGIRLAYERGYADHAAEMAG